MELERQIDHAQGFARAYGEAVGAHGDLGPACWMDLGSGGGLPGLVLAQCWPGSEGVLLDSSERRTAFLSGAVVALGWEGRVRVIRARAEDAGRAPDLRGAFEAVWARSFGSPPVTAECAAPFLCPGGLLVVSEPPGPEPGPTFGADGQEQGRWPRDGLASLGMEPLVRVRDRFGYQVVRQAGPCPDRFPRRAGVAAKRPLYRVVEH